MNKGSKAPFLDHPFHSVRLYLLQVPVAQHNATHSHYTWQVLSFVRPEVVHSRLHWNQTALTFSRKKKTKNKAAGEGQMFLLKLLRHPSISVRDRVAYASVMEGVPGSLRNNNASQILVRDPKLLRQQEVTGKFSHKHSTWFLFCEGGMFADEKKSSNAKQTKNCVNEDINGRKDGCSFSLPNSLV